MSENKWTKPNRLTEVISNEIREETVGDFPSKTVEWASKQTGQDGIRKGDKVWTVWTRLRTGLDKESLGAATYATKAEAQEAAETMPKGTIFGDGYGWPTRFKNMFYGRDATQVMSIMFSVGDDDAVDMVCYDAFFEAGVDATKFGELSRKALDWLGDEHVAWMKSEFGENWEVAAKFEYVINHFPDTSLVGLAAKLFLTRFITMTTLRLGIW